MKKILLAVLLTFAVLPKIASAAILTLDLSPANISAFSNVFIDPSGNMFGAEYFYPGTPNDVTGTFSFDTDTGIGSLYAKLTDTPSGEPWHLTGIFSGVSFINPVAGFDPGTDYDLYFEYLLNHNNGGNPNDYLNTTAIVFDAVDLDLIPDVANPTYQGLTHFAGGEMDGHDAYIHFNGPTSQFDLGYWCYTDYDNDGLGSGDTFAWDGKNASNIPNDGKFEGREIKEQKACDHFWNMNGYVPPDANVPEPATMALMGMGLAGFGLRKRNKK